MVGIKAVKLARDRKSWKKMGDFVVLAKAYDVTLFVALLSYPNIIQVCRSLSHKIQTLNLKIMVS